MNFSALKDFLDHLTSWRIPGNGVCVCLDGKEVFSYTSGYADVENKIPMTLDHSLNIYSCSKVITCTAALQLFEKGMFSLRDKLSKYMPEFENMTVKTDEGIKKAENPILIEHLFAMTAGFSYDVFSPNLVKCREETGGSRR